MSILNVNTIQPIGSGTTVTVAATELKTSNFITVGTGASITSPSANVLTLGTNTAERIRITSAGSIGIGTDNPGTKLDVRGGNWSNGDIVVGQVGNAGRVKFRRGADGSDSGSIGFSAADNNSVLSMNVASGDGTLTFQTNSTERLRITNNGTVHTAMTGTVPTWLGNTMACREKFSVFQGANFGEACFNIDVDNANSFLSHNMYYSGGWKIKKSGSPVRHLEIGTNGWTFMTGADGADDTTSALTERLRIYNDGSVRIGDNSVALAAVGSGPTLGINGSAPEITLRDSASELHMP